MSLFYELTEGDAIALAKQKKTIKQLPKSVNLVAISCNWGPPISGRFDTDLLNIWALTISETQVGELYLQGKGTDNQWSINELFQFSGIFQQDDPKLSFAFYKLMTGDYHVFPVEFVLRLDTYDGKQYYDNNDNKNYHLEPYVGIQVSAIPADYAIVDFQKIIHLTTRGDGWGGVYAYWRK